MYKYKWYTILKNIEDRQSKCLACIAGFFWCDFLFWFVFIWPHVRSTQKTKGRWGGRGEGSKKPQFFLSLSLIIFFFDLAHGRINTNQKRKSHQKKPAMQANHLLCLSSIFFNIVYNLYLYMWQSIPC